MPKFCDKISKLCLDHFEGLPKTGKPRETEWTILSCIVSEINSDLEVVALGTGSKCIGTDKLSPYGDILNDSHAEVMCRRAFLRYIYEIMMKLQQGETSILEFSPIDRKFTIKPHVKFHFFTTHVPCGDAAIFPKQNSEDVGCLIANEKTGKRVHDATEEFPEKRQKCNEDIFRTGAKCLEESDTQDLLLEGVGYHEVGVVRTKPGRGVRTLSVSCSDKIAKWCHLGLQGALLSILIDKPIYFSSFTVIGGIPFSKEALERALFDRLGNVSLSLPYQRQPLVIGQSNLVFKFHKTDGKEPCPSSIAWFKTVPFNKKTEVATEGRKQGATKKQLGKAAGRLKLCKFELFLCFTQIVKELNVNLIEVTDITTMSYKDAKLLSKNYQKAWSILRESFKCWTSKDNELLKFCVK